MTAGWMRWMRPSTSSARRSSASQSWTTTCATEAACPIRAEELLELATTRAAAEPSGHEDGYALAGEAVPLELVEHRGQRIAPRVVLDRGKRQ